MIGTSMVQVKTSNLTTKNLLLVYDISLETVNQIWRDGMRTFMPHIFLLGIIIYILLIFLVYHLYLLNYSTKFRSISFRVCET